jgi:N-dimethylarginine dimethylaminohydrolase
MNDLLQLPKKPDIWVGSEWGKLKEVIIGRADQLRYPSMNEMLKSRLHVFSPEEQEAFIACAGKLYSDIMPERHAKIVCEVENWVKLLESRGIKVHRPRLLTDNELNHMQTGVSSVFIKDPLSVVGNLVIEGANRVEFRHKDVFAYRHIMENRVLGSNAKWLSMPKPMVDESDLEGGKGPFLTGGDIFVMGNNNVLLGHNGIDSNMLGLQWLASILEAEGWNVHFVEYSPKVMHLDCCLSAPREGLALVCKDAFPNGLPKLLDGWDLVDCSLEDAKIDACNGLPLDDGVYAMSAQFKHIGNQLAAKGIEVLYCDMTELNHATGGGMRCSHGPLVRED